MLELHVLFTETHHQIYTKEAKAKTVLLLRLDYLKRWSHSKLLKSKGPLKDKAVWQSLVFSLLPHSFMLKSCLLVCFFPLDTTSTHLWPTLAPNEHKGLCWFSRLFPTAGSRLCQFLLPGHTNSSLPDFYFLKEGSEDCPNKVSHQQNPAFNYNYCSYDSWVSLLIEVCAQQRPLILQKYFQVTSKPGNETNFPPPK